VGNGWIVENGWTIGNGWIVGNGWTIGNGWTVGRSEFTAKLSVTHDDFLLRACGRLRVLPSATGNRAWFRHVTGCDPDGFPPHGGNSPSLFFRSGENDRIGR